MAAMKSQNVLLSAGLPLSVETCPHYLAMSAEDVPDGDTRFKCAPPIREATNRNVLIAALLVSLCWNLDHCSAGILSSW